MTAILTAAAPPATLVTMLVVIGILLPVRLNYNGCQYRVFRDQTPGSGYDEE